ncbi:hypothetical protein EVAR_90414_1 [Eumeta japonica]|uniref:Uncharacterized protein n=1 Tax=Eumeta variegata TaxID=151549 RepID=A0A4C1Y8S2_EUMVA|nr:hypothetical protein EVAR_90414_1 [Eumeta japonica]
MHREPRHVSKSGDNSIRRPLGGDPGSPAGRRNRSSRSRSCRGWSEVRDRVRQLRWVLRYRAISEEAGKALVTPLWLGVYVGVDNRLLSGCSQTR